MRNTPLLSSRPGPVLAVLLSLALAAWPAPAALAQEGDEELEEEFELLEESAEVVVSAARHEQKIGFSPSAVVVITRREIEASGAATLTDLLRRWPVTHIYEFDPLYPTAEVRTSYRVMLLIDGREANLEMFVSPFYACLPVGLPEVERIEIVLGPSSAIYGANAVSAVINVITRRPERGAHGEAVLAAGEHGGLELDLRASGGAGPLSLKASGGLSLSDSWMQQGQAAKNVWRGDLRAGLDLDPIGIDFYGGLNRVEGRIFSVMGTLTVPYTWLPYAGLVLKYKNLQVHSYWYGVRSRLRPDIGLYYPVVNADLGRIPDLHLTGDTVHGEVQLNLEPFSGNMLILGVDTRYTRYHSPQFVEDTAAETRLGVYFHDEQKLGDKWLLQAGLRYDWNSRTDWALSPRGAVIFNPAGEHFFRLSGGMAFRKPSMMETVMNFEIEPNPAFPEIDILFERYGLSNPDLGNELLSSVELGWRSSWLEGRLKASADAYAAFNRHIIGFRNDVVFDDTPLGPQLNLQRSKIGYEDLDDDSNVFGAYLTLEGKPLEWLSVFARADIRRAFFIEQGNQENRWYPRYILAAGATFEAPGDLHGQAVLMNVGATTNTVRHPESILLPELTVPMPTILYLMLYLARDFRAGPLELELGLSFLNAFNSRFREEPGTINRKGTNFGGEMLGRRLMALLKVIY